MERDPVMPNTDQVKEALGVVVGVDGSEDGQRAVAFGVREAKKRHTTVHLVHAVDDAMMAGAWGVVYDPDLLRESGAQILDDAVAHAATIDPSVEVTTEIAMGNPGSVLTRLSERAEAVIVGRRAMSGLERLFVGSTSVGIAATAACPVILVSAASHRAETGALGVIGVGIDATTRSRDALAYAFAEAQRRGCRLEVIHAFELAYGFFADVRNREEREAGVRAAAEQGIEDLLASLRTEFPEVEVTVSIVRARPVEHLLERSQDLDLMVLGVHGLPLPGLAPGATVRAVMAHGSCPLALVRQFDEN